MSIRNEGCLLVGTDFSQGALAALSTARELAHGLGRRPVVIHVMERMVSGASWRTTPAVETWLAAAGLESSDLHVRAGLPYVELLRFAEDVGAGLLIMGSHGSSGYQPLSLGSTASRLALLSPIPVVLANPRTTRSSAVAMAVGSVVRTPPA